MRDYYIVRSGRLRRHENTIQLEFGNGEKKSLPINDIRSMHLFGEVDLNTKLIVFLNQHGIPLHFYNYYGYYSGSFYPREKLLSGFLLVKQVQHYIDASKRLEIAREIVRTAIHNILANLMHYKKSGKEVDAFIEKIRTESESIDNANDVQQLMGIEGRTRDSYYSSFDTILREGFKFEKRTKMPPQNMLNSLISFGNSLLYSTTLTEIYHTQLSPTVSYLHEPGERRYSLALDVSEVFKPIIKDRNSIVLPNRKVEIFLDLEGTDPTMTDEEVIQVDYLIGILVRVDSREQYKAFIAKDLKHEKDMLFEFLDFMKKQKDYVIYHYHNYEKIHLKKMMEKYKVDEKTRNIIFDHMIDVYKAANDSVAFPTYGNGLKQVAAFLGFVWRHKDVDATESIALYLDYIANPKKNQDKLQLILDYNKDDCVATRVIKEWLETVRDDSQQRQL